MGKPFLSIIIPAHNESKRLPGSLENINGFVIAQVFETEVIVVENGSTDNTAEIVHQLIPAYPFLRLIEEKERGKGLAVRRGMLEAQGEFIFQADADLSMPIEEIGKFLPPQLPQCEIAIASRELPEAKRFNEPAYRHLIGRAFNTLVRVTVLPGLQDTQCGFKCYRADAAKKIFALQTLKGMSFDAEVLVIARQHGYSIQEVPIQWYFDPDSRVRLIKDSLRMALDLLTIRRNRRLGMYDAHAV